MAAGLTIESPSLATTTPNGTKSSATEAVKGTINDLIQVLDDETLKQPEQAEKRRHEIEELIKHRVDYEEMARRALPVDFRLIHRAHKWQVYDVVIDGASIVSNYRSQFTSIIRGVSCVGLVKKMKQKAIVVKVFEKSPAP